MDNHIRRYRKLVLFLMVIVLGGGCLHLLVTDNMTTRQESIGKVVESNCEITSLERVKSDSIDRVSLDNANKDAGEIIIENSNVLQNSFSGEVEDMIDSRKLVDEDLFLKSVTGKYINLKESNSYDEYLLRSSIDITDGFSEVLPCHVKGGIIPHHMVAHQFIGEFYQFVSEVDYDLIVLLSPNHYTSGPRFQVGTFDYITYSGTVKCDRDIVASLIENDLFKVADKTYLEKEHGQLVHMPYIDYYFPDIEVVSLMLAETRDMSDLSQAAKLIHEEVNDKNVLYVGSIDFSHYLPLDYAEEMDAYTYELINNNDLNNMIGLSNDHIDSPSSFVLLNELLDYASPHVMNHGNSAVFLNQLNLAETTSYFQVIYY